MASPVQRNIMAMYRKNIEIGSSALLWKRFVYEMLEWQTSSHATQSLGGCLLDRHVGVLILALPINEVAAGNGRRGACHCVAVVPRARASRASRP